MKFPGRRSHPADVAELDSVRAIARYDVARRGGRPTDRVVGTRWPPALRSVLARAAVPAALVPIRLPWTTVPVVRLLLRKTPLPPFPEITLPVPAAVPPIVLFGELTTWTPTAPLARAAVPAALVPMRFPWTKPPEDGLPILTPFCWLAEIRLRVSGVVPPTTLPVPPLINTPLLFGKEALEPAASVPMKLPSMWLFDPMTLKPLCPPRAPRLITRPRTVEPPVMTMSAPASRGAAPVDRDRIDGVERPWRSCSRRTRTGRSR